MALVATPPNAYSAFMSLVEMTISSMATWFRKNSFDPPPPVPMLLLMLIPSHITMPSYSEAPWMET